MKITPTILFSTLMVISIFSSSSAWATTIVSNESVANGIRRIVLLDDNGTKSTQLQKCGKTTREWFEARFDENSKQWVFTDKGERERRARIQFFKSEQRRIDRQFQRQND